MSVETYISVQEAVQRYSLNTQLLTRLVRDGKIRGGKFNGTFVLSEEDTQQVAERQATKEELRSKVAHLEGHPIGVLEASRKYDLNNPTICRWIQAGYIRTLSSPAQRGQKRLIDESDVAYAKELSTIRKAGQGKQVFIPEFIPDWF